MSLSFMMAVSYMNILSSTVYTEMSFPHQINGDARPKFLCLLMDPTTMPCLGDHEDLEQHLLLPQLEDKHAYHLANVLETAEGVGEFNHSLHTDTLSPEVFWKAECSDSHESSDGFFLIFSDLYHSESIPSRSALFPEMVADRWPGRACHTNSRSPLQPPWCGVDFP